MYCFFFTLFTRLHPSLFVCSCFYTSPFHASCFSLFSIPFSILSSPLNPSLLSFISFPGHLFIPSSTLVHSCSLLLFIHPLSSSPSSPKFTCPVTHLNFFAFHLPFHSFPCPLSHFPPSHILALSLLFSLPPVLPFQIFTPPLTALAALPALPCRAINPLQAGIRATRGLNVPAVSPDPAPRPLSITASEMDHQISS